MLKEFKAFAMRGNVLDMVMGILIGAAFGKIVSSLGNDTLMSPVGLLVGRVDFSNLFINLSGDTPPTLAAAAAAGAVTINDGLFLNTVLNFPIVTFAIFLLIRQINRMARQSKAGPVAPTTQVCPRCLSTIHREATRYAYCISVI